VGTSSHLAGPVFAAGEREAVADTSVDKRILVFLAARDFDFREYRGTTGYLARHGLRISVASTDTSAQATNDSVISPDLRLGTLDPTRYAGLVLIGGVGSVLFWDDSAALQMVRSFASDPQHVIGAIGLGPIMLAKADLLKGRAAAVYNDPRAAKMLEQAGAHYRYEQVVTDGNFITASSSDAAEQFARAFERRLQELGD
jgi:putative intracellular protease/amidase